VLASGAARDVERLLLVALGYIAQLQQQPLDQLLED